MLRDKSDVEVGSHGPCGRQRSSLSSHKEEGRGTDDGKRQPPSVVGALIDVEAWLCADPIDALIWCGAIHATGGLELL